MITVNGIGEKPDLQDALKHYGVKGMKWGVRRDQATLDRAAGRKPPKTDTSGLVGNPLVIYGASVAAALAIQGILNYRDSGRKDAKETGDRPFKQKPELTKKMPPKELHSKVVKPINPGFGEKGTQMNCRRATLAYEMRRRGNDVQATKSTRASGQDPGGMAKAVGADFKDSMWGEKPVATQKEIWKASPEKRAELIFEDIGKNPNGARGELGVAWAFGGGHSIAWEIVDNKPVIFDTQNAKMYSNSKEFAKFTPIVLDAATTRLDNKTIDDEFIKRWVKDVQ